MAVDVCLASRDINICLIPEFIFDLDGNKGLLNYIKKFLKINHYCIIAVTEGAFVSLRET